MALQRFVHQPVNGPEPRGVLTNQMRAQLANARARALRVGRQIKRPQRAHFAMAGEAGIGFEGHHGAVKHRHRFAAGPLVDAFVQREINLINLDACDFHFNNS